MTDDAEARLLAVFRALAEPDRHALQAYAEFLAQRGVVAVEARPEAAAPVNEPRPEARPERESVVMAIKRLTRTYPMLDRRKLMGPTSLLVSQHALQGRPAAAVIDELEMVFARHYRESVKREP